jgi:replicative DNA helicase
MIQKKLFSQQTTSAEHILGKNLPCNLEAERAVLGSLLLNDERMTTVAEILTAKDFYAPSHSVVYDTMLEIVQRNQRIDLITVQDELTKKNQLNAVGGIVYLVSLQEDIPTIGLLEQHAHIVKEKSILRELINSATHIIASCYEQHDDGIERVLDEAEKTIFTISAQRSQESFTQLTVWLRKTFKHLSEIRGQHKGITGVSVGFRKLNEMTSGFQPSDLIILAGRPSMGKTAMGLSIAQHVAAEGKGVGFFSLEMSAEQLTLRLLSMHSGIPNHAIRNATLTSDEWTALTNAASELGTYNFFIDDTALQTIMDIRTKARKLKLEHDIQMLIIDYLQLINVVGRRYENRHQEVSEISRSLKALAKELKIPILALSQLSRAVDSRVDKRPILSDLRESGAIEQDADLIMFLYRDSVYNPEAEDPTFTELIIGKQRNGPTGTVNIHYNHALTLFIDGEDR